MTAGIRSLAWLCAALSLAACGSPPAQAQAWEVLVQPGGEKVARGALGGGAGLVQGIGLTCERGVPMIALGLARAAARNPALLSLSDGRSTGKLGVVRTGANKVWAGPVRDPRVLAMLARAASVEVAIDGMRYGTVSLAGAAEAMRGALGGCWEAAGAAVVAQGASPTEGGSVPRPAGAGVALLPIKDLATGQPRFPVKLGTYVETGKSCAAIGRGVEAEQIDVSGAPSLGMITELRSIREVSPGIYTGRVYWSSGGDAEESFSLRVQDSEHFSWAVKPNKAVRYSYCRPETVPEDARLWLKSDYRTVQTLPIKSGYYSCGKQCGYYLFRPDGYSSVTQGEYGVPNGQLRRASVRATKITQTAPRRYVLEAENGGGEFIIHSPTSFDIDEGECEECQQGRFVPVDPKTIPASQLPR